MRTYKPKKRIYEEIENVGELCRLCLEKTEEGVPIFKDEQDVCSAVAMRIMICVGLEIKCDNSLPNMICKTCYEELEKYYKFRRKCAASYHKLKYHVIANKLKEQGNTGTDVSVQYTDVTVPPNDMEEEKPEVQIVKGAEDDSKQLIMQFPGTSLEVKDNLTTEPVEVEQVETPLRAEINPDMDTFLSGILMELGILRRQDGDLVLQQGCTRFQLETGDGQQLMLELVEEDDQLPLNKAKNVMPETQKNVIEVSEEPAMVIDIEPKSDNKTKGGKTSRPWCSVCGRAFSSRSAAARHERSHTGSRPYACHCGATFTQNCVLRRHMLVHLDVRPHRCPRCDKSFTQRGALASHVRAHAAPPARALALHRCTLCDRVFLHTSGLSRHMFTHTGRVYECSACDKTFRDKSSLNRHLKNVYHKGLANNSANVPTVKIASNDMSTSSDNVTENDLPDTINNHDFVVSNKISDGNMTSNKMSDGNMTGNKMSDGNMTCNKTSDGNMTGNKTSDGI